jgi:hypothetical protein
MLTFRNTLFHLHRQVGRCRLTRFKKCRGIHAGRGLARAIPFPLWIPQHFSNLVILHLPAYEDGTECSETSAYKIQAAGNYPEESIQHTKHGESLKSRIHSVCVLHEIET